MGGHGGSYGGGDGGQRREELELRPDRWLEREVSGLEGKGATAKFGGGGDLPLGETAAALDNRGDGGFRCMRILGSKPLN